MKTVTCSICDETVSKRKTVAIGDGKRACRSHSEAIAASEDIQTKEKLERAEKAKQAASRRDRSSGYYEARCGVCNNIGVSAQEFYSRLLIAMEKYELATGKLPNMFNPDEVKVVKGSLSDIRCLFRKELKEIKDNGVRLTRNAEIVADLIGLTFVCADCMSQHGLKHPLKNAPVPDLKSAFMLGAIVKPIARRAALDELSQDQ